MLHPPQAADESVLTPRFYTTDFDEMEQLFSLKLNPNLPMEELEVRLVATVTRCADALPFRPHAMVLLQMDSIFVHKMFDQRQGSRALSADLSYEDSR